MWFCPGVCLHIMYTCTVCVCVYVCVCVCVCVCVIVKLMLDLLAGLEQLVLHYHYRMDIINRKILGMLKLSTLSCFKVLFATGFVKWDLF